MKSAILDKLQTHTSDQNRLKMSLCGTITRKASIGDEPEMELYFVESTDALVGILKIKDMEYHFNNVKYYSTSPNDDGSIKLTPVSV